MPTNTHIYQLSIKCYIQTHLHVNHYKFLIIHHICHNVVTQTPFLLLKLSSKSNKTVRVNLWFLFLILTKLIVIVQITGYQLTERCANVVSGLVVYFVVISVNSCSFFHQLCRSHRLL